MKILLSFLAVAFLVTSAFAFANKGGSYCVLNNTGTACEIRANVVQATGTANNTHFPLFAGKWDGTHLGCTNASPDTDCVVPIRLIID
jgi:hypothetical protein